MTYGMTVAQAIFTLSLKVMYLKEGNIEAWIIENILVASYSKYACVFAYVQTKQK